MSIWGEGTDGSLLVLAAASKVVIYDVSAPTSPVRASEMATTNAKDAEVDGSWVYIADGSNGILVVDASDPTQPQVATTVSLPPYTFQTQAIALDLLGDRLYVAAGDSFFILDVSAPASASVLGSTSWTLLDLAYDRVVQVAADPAHPGYAYVLRLHNEPTSPQGYTFIPYVYVIDVSSPSTPAVVRTTGPFGGLVFTDVQPFPSIRHTLTTLGDVVILTFYTEIWQFQSASRLATFDVRDPLTASLSGTLDEGWTSDGHVSIGPHTVLWSAGGGLHEVEVSPTAPPSITQTIPVGLAGGLSRVGDCLFFGASSLGEYDLQACGSGLAPVGAPEPIASAGPSFTVWPNPWTSTLGIQWTQGTSVNARVEVLDVTGRRLATLAEGPSAAGIRTIRWNGRDDDGRPVASGTYFVRLTQDGVSAARRVLHLR